MALIAKHKQGWAIALAVVGFLALAVVPSLSGLPYLFDQTLQRVALFALVALFVAALGGARSLVPSDAGLARALREGRYPVLLALGLCALEAAALLQAAGAGEAVALSPSWASDLVGAEIKDKEMIYVPGIDGLDVVLTIDSVIQSVVEDVLRLIMRAHNPKSAKAVVMNVNTGEILAMGITPGLDLNNLPRDDIQTLMDNGRNTLLTDIYEPGSTFKIITAAANMEEYKNGNPSAFSPTHVFGNSNFRIINGSRISCWTSHANGRHSNQTLAAALNNSCNPIFTDIALSLGVETFYDYLDLFGIGENTGIDFAGEQAGMLVPEASVTAGDLARIGFGQTIAVTPLQLITAVSCAVNGGLLMKPYLVREIRSGDMTAARFTPSVRNRAVSEETSRNLALMLEDVVKNGSGKQAYIEGYRVGGKTGTAQKFENGHIADGKYVSSFVGFFPANRPEYAAIVIVDELEGQHYGSTVAAPYAKIITIAGYSGRLTMRETPVPSTIWPMGRGCAPAVSSALSVAAASLRVTHRT